MLVAAIGMTAVGAMVVSPGALAQGITSGPVSPGIDWIVMDVATGQVLSEHGAQTERYPASLTKLMTLDLAFQQLRAGRLNLDTPLPVSAEATRVQPVKLNLVPGQTITVRQAMLGMTTMSANDAATALGQYLGGGSISRVAAEMTAHARALGMRRTQFYNPSGLPNPGQVTDAYDMAILTRHILLTYPQYRYLFSIRSFNFEGRTINNIDGMLKLYPGTIGMKTGFTDLARFNLVTAAVRGGHLLVGVELHSPSWSVAYRTMTKLLDAGFAAEGVQSVPVIVARNTIPDAKPEARTAPSRRNTVRRDLVAMRQRRPAVHHLVQHSGHVTQDMIPGWTAQIGAYGSYADAERQAILVHGERHVGVARVSRIVVHHRHLWRAQLAGLDKTDAQRTCTLLSHHHRSCFIIAPHDEHLAMR
ncbi:MAG TPA: D-alanyl-D-alanine carboxypeptidase [Acidiphilium sp.]